MSEQRSAEWFRQRMGRCTSSRFADVLAGPRSAAYLSYAKQLRAELAALKQMEVGEIIQTVPDFDSPAMAWGRKYEPIARAEYEFRHDCDVTVPSFCVHPSYPFIGASPDGLRFIYGMEIKCPFNPLNHARTLVHGMPDDHIAQVQGGMWVCYLATWDFVSFDPRRSDSSRYYEQRIKRDDRYIVNLERAVLEFWAFVQSDEDMPSRSDSIPVLF